MPISITRVVRTLAVNRGGNGGSSDHTALTNLPFDESGHTGTGGGATSFPSFGTTGAAVLSTASAFLTLLDGVSSAALTAALAAFTGSANIVTLGTIATGVWNATAIGVTKGGTGLTTAALGDLIYGSAADTLARLSGNTTTTPKLLAQVGNGSVSAAPTWEAYGTTGASTIVKTEAGGTVAASILPAATTSTAGAQKIRTMRIWLIKDTAAVVYTNQPAAYGALNGNFSYVSRADLSNYTEYRFLGRVSSASGATGSKVLGRITTSVDMIDGTTVWRLPNGDADPASVGSNQPQLAWDTATGTWVASAWASLHADFRTDVTLGAACDGGNGAADPGWSDLGWEFR